jgi:hypothetical protein
VVCFSSVLSPDADGWSIAPRRDAITDTTRRAISGETFLISPRHAAQSIVHATMQIRVRARANYVGHSVCMQSIDAYLLSFGVGVKKYKISEKNFSAK